MTLPVQQKANTADTVVTRTNVVRLLQEVACSEQLDISSQDLRGINLVNFNLRWANLSQTRVCEANLCEANLAKADLHGASLCWADLRGANLRVADLSWASFGGESTFELTKHQLRQRGATFSEKTNVIVAERFSEDAGRYLDLVHFM